MKKITFLQAILFASTLLFAVTAQSQIQNEIASLGPTRERPVDIATTPTSGTFHKTALTTFLSTFPDATDISWSTYAGALPTVFFKTPGKTNRAAFDRKGNIVYTISYYKEEMLPVSVLQKVKQNYYGKIIFGVTEINSDKKTAYFIVLEDKTSLLNIKVLDNEIQEGQVYIKTQP